MPSYMDDMISEIKKKKQETLNESVKADNAVKKQPSLADKIPENVEKTGIELELEKIKNELKESVKAPLEPQKKKKIVFDEPVKKAPLQKKETGFELKEAKEKPVEKEEEQEFAAERKIVGEGTDTEMMSSEQKEIETAEKALIDSYGDVKIFKVKGKSLLHYTVPVQRPTTTEKTIINTIKEAATRLITISPYKIRDNQQKRSIYYQKVLEILQNSPQLNIQKRRWSFYAEAVVREMVGYGIIDSLVNDDNLEEIMVIGPRIPVYIFHREYEMMTTNIEFFVDQEIVDLINRVARQVGRRVDISAPLLDARLPDGSRVNATIPPASVSGSTITIRKFRKDPLTIVDLIKNNTLDIDLAAFLWVCVEGLGVKPANILISGGTGSGKTTLLNSLGAFIEPQERIISIEDTAELNLPLKHWIRFEGRPPGLEGSGELTIDILTKNSLRMRPDRVMVGEIRHAEAFSLFTAMNTGHDGRLSNDALIQLSNGNLVEIEEFVNKVFEEKTSVKEGEFEFAEVSEKIFVPSLNKQTLKIEDKEVTHVWRKKSESEIIKIKLQSGKTISLTPDHPIYRINNGIEEINAGNAKEGDYICVLQKFKSNATKKLENHTFANNASNKYGKTLLQILEKNIKTMNSNDLKILNECGLQAEEIVLITTVTENEPGYDLTVKGNHSYIANGVIVSNCMGTVHANSAKETVIRVTSPPMNVPEVMLSGLDIIVVEQRLHDKKMGTIRRITDISEVSGVLEGKTATKLIYEYDHVADKLKRTKNEITFLKILQRFTGWSSEKMNQELEKRKKFLKYIVDKKIRKMQDVYDACQKFVYEQSMEVEKNANTGRLKKKN
ncbi:MAG: Flp pilus assembly complex ATPase component TadA, partial [Candidatus Diapherotrites archaeon]|nr:Flp pilus assembly complex ATPase component TadA [Candidatus Diapherotrites archaeon]